MGTWGQDWATQVVPTVPDARLVGCVDARPAALASTVKLGVADADRCFPSLDAAVDGADFDAVLITTDPRSHIGLVMDALVAGKHVLVEKPFALSLPEAQQAVTTADDLGLTVMVSQNYRFFPAVHVVQQITREKTLGELLYIDLDFRRYSPPSPGGPTGHRAWFQPLLFDMSIHHFDLMRAIIRSEPTTVYCRTYNPLWADYIDPPEGCATIDFGDGLMVNYRGSWLHPGQKTPWAGEWRMVFEDGELWWTSRGDLHTEAEDRAALFDHHAARTPVALPHLPFLDRAGALDAFVTALSEGVQPESTGRENLGSLALAHAALDSSLKREPVAVPTVLPD
jgi:predicted dehydrogenase